MIEWLKKWLCGSDSSKDVKIEEHSSGTDLLEDHAGEDRGQEHNDHRPFDHDPKRGQYIQDEKGRTSGPAWVLRPHPAAYGGSYHYISNRLPQKPTKETRCKWRLRLREAGRYEFWADWRASANRSRSVEYRLMAVGVRRVYRVSQWESLKDGGGIRWRKLAELDLPAGNVTVEVPNTKGHSESVDAIGLRRIA